MIMIAVPHMVVAIHDYEDETPGKSNDSLASPKMSDACILFPIFVSSSYFIILAILFLVFDNRSYTTSGLDCK